MKMKRIIIAMLVFALVGLLPCEAVADGGAFEAAQPSDLSAKVAKPKQIAKSKRVDLWVVASSGYKGYDYPKTEYSYNSKGFLTRKSTQNYTPDEDQYEYVEEPDGSVSIYQVHEDPQLVTEMYEYDKKGRMTKRVLSHSKKLTPWMQWRCKYDKKGRLVKRVEWHPNYDTPEVTRFKYNKAGQCVKSVGKVKIQGDAVRIERRFTYNEKGQLAVASQEWARKSGKKKRYTVEDEWSFSYAYDKKGNLSKVEQGSMCQYAFKTLYRSSYRGGRIVKRAQALTKKDLKKRTPQVFKYRRISVPASKAAAVRKQQRDLFNPSPFGELQWAARVLD